MKDKMKKFLNDHKEAIVVGLTSAGLLTIVACVAEGRTIVGGGMSVASEDVFLVHLKNGHTHVFNRPKE